MVYPGHEKAHLMSMPEPFDRYVEKPPERVDHLLMSVARNRHFVLCELAVRWSARGCTGTASMWWRVTTSPRAKSGNSDAGQTRYDRQSHIPPRQWKLGRRREGRIDTDLFALRRKRLVDSWPKSGFRRQRRELGLTGDEYFEVLETPRFRPSFARTTRHCLGQVTLCATKPEIEARPPRGVRPWCPGSDTAFPGRTSTRTAVTRGRAAKKARSRYRRPARCRRD